MQSAMLLNVHVPERLEGESVDAYHTRRRWSKQFAGQTTVLTAYPMRHRVDAMRAARRKAVRAIGIRQYKKGLR